MNFGLFVVAGGLSSLIAVLLAWQGAEGKQIWRRVLFANGAAWAVGGLWVALYMMG